VTTSDVTIWFTSDQHFGHRKLASLRGFSSLDAMHDAIVARHNAVVAADDEVYHLGDFSLDDRIVPSIIRELRGRHHLVAGNHDRCHPCHQRHLAAARKYVAAGFVDVHEQQQLVLEPIGLVALCHLPYVGDRTDDDRLPDMRPVPGDERCLLHGHVHDAWRVRFVELAGRPRPMINVGVDQWELAPVGVPALAALIGTSATSSD
jgi:calcineurin-like phosphoesterase family protein